MQPNTLLHPETLLVHEGRTHNAEGAVAAPINLSSTYARNEGEPPAGFIYSRLGNPNRQALEQCLVALEGGVACAAFASGSAATAAVFQALRPGDHVVVAREAYYGSIKMLETVLQPWGLEITFADMTNLDAVRASIRSNTRLLWVETPSNPLLSITDISACAEIAHANGALLAVDNTFATPLLTRPLDLGADLVMHATSKYLAGHSDVVGGAVVARNGGSELFQRIRSIQLLAGAVPGPFDCWLVLRGIRTLAVRLRQQCESAARIAEHLASHPKVSKVYYPALSSHPNFVVANRQMKQPGAMLSFQVAAGREASLRVAQSTRLFQQATSLGGVESLIEHRASVEQYTTSTPDNLLRLSIGLEHVEDLIGDVDRALAP